MVSLNGLFKSSSHDLLEGCVKLWMKIIIENLVRCNWFTWEGLERLMEQFPYVYKDASNKPPIFRRNR